MHICCHIKLESFFYGFTDYLLLQVHNDLLPKWLSIGSEIVKSGPTREVTTHLAKKKKKKSQHKPTISSVGQHGIVFNIMHVVHEGTYHQALTQNH